MNARERHRYLLAGAGLCAAGDLVVAFLSPRVAAAGWLIGFASCSAIPVGSLVLLMIHRLTGGRWGEAVRPTLEAAAATIPLLVVLILPLFVAIPVLYPWSGAADGVKPDVLAVYLNVPFFIARSLVALAGWSVLAILLPRYGGGRGQLLAAVGLAFHCAIIGAIGFDWFLSVAPPFGSSSFGASLAVTQLIAALAFALLITPVRTDDPVAGDLGGLLLALVLGLTYIDFMAVLVIWYGDVPKTVAWFAARMGPAWRAIAIASFLLGSLAPIASLLSPRVRNNPRPLRLVAATTLAGLVCYHAYLLAPPFGVVALLPAALAGGTIGLLLVALITGGWRLVDPGNVPGAAHGR
jgi:hypothetical protein